MIVFTKTVNGHTARIDDIELTVAKCGYELVIYEKITVYPCEQGGCPSGRTVRECPSDPDCSYAKEAEHWISSDLNLDFSSLAEVEKHVRAQFARGWYGDGPDDPCLSHYPQPAAARFAHEEWRYEQKD